MKLYLEQLIYALNESDIERLRNMDLRKSKMKYYLSMLMDGRKEGMAGKDTIMSALELDSNSLLKLRSITLTRCYNELAPQGSAELLHFLSRYRLGDLFVREADRVIAEITGNVSISAEQKNDIYLQIAKGYLRLPFSFFDEKKMNGYYRLFLANYSAPDKPVMQEIIRLNELYIIIVKSFFSGNTSKEKYDAFWKEIKTIEAKSDKLNSTRLKYFVRGIHLILDFYFRKKWIELQHALENLAHLYISLNDPTTYHELFVLRFYIAYNQIMINDFRKANEYFGLMENEYGELFHRYPHITYRYGLSLLMEGRNAECRKLIDSYLEKDIVIYKPDQTIKSCIVCTAYHLMENEIEEAGRYVNLFNSIINKKDLMALKNAMKFIEIIYYYQRGDKQFAYFQTTKFERYLNDKSNLPGVASLADVVKVFKVQFNKLLLKKMDEKTFEMEINTVFRGIQSILTKLFVHAHQLENENEKAVTNNNQ